MDHWGLTDEIFTWPGLHWPAVAQNLSWETEKLLFLFSWGKSVPSEGVAKWYLHSATFPAEHATEQFCATPSCSWGTGVLCTDPIMGLWEIWEWEELAWDFNQRRKQSMGQILSYGHLPAEQLYVAAAAARSGLWRKVEWRGHSNR